RLPDGRIFAMYLLLQEPQKANGPLLGIDPADLRARGPAGSQIAALPGGGYRKQAAGHCRFPAHCVHYLHAACPPGYLQGRSPGSFGRPAAIIYSVISNTQMTDFQSLGLSEALL